MRGRLLYVVNSVEFFLSHRLPVAMAAQQQGYEVHVATPLSDAGATREITARGMMHHPISLSRRGTNPVVELWSLWRLYRLMCRVRPDVVHLVTIKPVLYGGIAARLAGVPGLVAAVSGLGAVFMDGRDGIVRRIVHGLYRLALGHPNARVIFQNPDDRAALVQIGAVRPEQGRLIRGSGVRLADYPYLPEPEGRPVVTMAARLLRDKGVDEFVQMAQRLRAEGVDAEFRLIGSPDPGNPSSVAPSDVERWRTQGDVTLPGYRADIARQYAESHIVCLPSYREGLPKSLVEAAACGRAVVTTDVPGCRDAIEPGESGLLVPVRDVDALARVVRSLLEDPERRRRMGEAGRRLAEREFAIERIVDAHLAIYRDVLARAADRQEGDD
ncbi:MULTISPECIES: glycosyltransferase family 4 protein [unclassified Guyparkeria]|uniref:glycosyltransferase family 4 protein n=1 Tax=unclassified Guyparkeria TaxID=2626246 RepID=UPI000733978C|nr:MULTISPECIES: glycosyltransferase family 4 protein [unclassified Guyparkeria]KTG16277.1 glycosyl transferase family 1 [Guyparkeria sp. XI15]OAE85128.1 glycosyl transferase family 1 [Guyparkeria sp. WRN-7]